MKQITINRCSWIWGYYFLAVGIIICFDFLIFRNRFETAFRDQVNIYPMEINASDIQLFNYGVDYELLFKVSDKPLTGLSLLLHADPEDSSSLAVSVGAINQSQTLTFDLPATMINAAPLVRLDIASLKIFLGSTVKVKIQASKPSNHTSIGYYQLANPYLSQRLFLAGFYQNSTRLEKSLSFRPEYLPGQQVNYRLTDAYYDEVIRRFTQDKVGYQLLYVLAFLSLSISLSLWLYHQAHDKSRKSKFTLVVKIYIVMILIATYPFV